MIVKSVTINRRDFDAAIFDLDGVLTSSARVHATAWKTVFDAFLQKWAQEHGLLFQPFDIEAEYLTYVDGLPRYDGVRSFLSGRGITLPEGSERDPENADTVHALGERKTRLFQQALLKGIEPAAGAEALLKKLKNVGIRTAVASSSKNVKPFCTLPTSITTSMSALTGLSRKRSGCGASRIRHCFSKPHVAWAFSRRAQSCSRMRWLASKPVNGADSDA